MADLNTDPESFDRLPAELRAWAVERGWGGLRPVQAKAWDWFATNDPTSSDLLVCAPTATGKTEAVFLPLLSRLSEWDTEGISILYICPLKALIDQQTERLKPLFETRRVQVFARHGEARAARAALQRRPEGLLIITPESLEGLLRRGEASAMFKGLKAVVIDELHAFFGSPRGVQIIAQLARLDDILGYPVQRIGLSATLSPDVEPETKAFLRPAAPDRVAVVADDTAITPIRFELRAYVDEAAADADFRSARTQLLEDLRQSIAEPMAQGAASAPHKTLVFCNARATVEWCATELRGSSPPGDPEADLVYPHHGSLKRDARKLAEAALRDPARATLVVSSPTLELGLDVGDIEYVVQVDPGPSVASLRQRLGRSGRRAGKVSQLLLMVREEPGGAEAHPLARLHVALVQSLAQLVLVQDRRFEAPPEGALNLSTFVQQTLSMAEQGVDLQTIVRVLLTAGPFVESEAAVYRDVVTRLAREADDDLPGVKPLLEPPLEGGAEVLRLAPEGVKLAHSPSFGAAFAGGRQYTVRAGAEVLGQLPGGHNLKPGDPVFFAGRRWAVQTILETPPTVLLHPSGGGRPPRFAGSPIPPSGLVVSTMRQLYTGERALPGAHLGAMAEQLWSEAREAYQALDLDQEPCQAWDEDVVLFPWAGPRQQAALIAALRHLGLNAGPAHVAVVALNATADQVRQALARIAEWDGLPRPDDLARGLKSTRFEKFDGELGPYLQRLNYASARLDVEGAKAAAAGMLKG